MRRSRKPFGAQVPRGFKSLPLRLAMRFLAVGERLAWPVCERVANELQNANWLVDGFKSPPGPAGSRRHETIFGRDGRPASLSLTRGILWLANQTMPGA